MAAATNVKDVLIVGFGAIGAMHALKLKQSGLARVTVVARSNYDAVNENGAQFKSDTYGNLSGWRPDRLVKSISEAADQSYSYVFLTTKAVPEYSPTPSVLKPLISPPYVDEHPLPTFILLQNGLGVEVDLYNAIKQLGKGEPSIVSTALWLPTNLAAPNFIVHAAGPDRITLGMYRYEDYTTNENSPAEIAILEDIGGLLKSGDSDVLIVPEVQRHKFAKNFWNVAYSAFATLTGHRNTAIFRSPPADPPLPDSPHPPYVYPITADLIEQYTIPTIKAILDELVVLGRALGYPDTKDGLPATIADDVLNESRHFYRTPGGSHKPSMSVDAEKGQPMEVEVIFGAVVRMARSRGVDVPRVELLYALLLVVQNQNLGSLIR